jgi:serine/threonine-protein kinase
MDAERRIARFVATLGQGPEATLVDVCSSLRPPPRTGRVDPQDLPLLSIAGVDLVGERASQQEVTVPARPGAAGAAAATAGAVPDSFAVGLRTGQAGSRGSIPEFQIVGQLGEGGMGVVLLARQTPLEREVAIKGVRPSNEGTGTTENSLALVQEAVITGSLGHPNVVPVHALGRDHRGLPLLVMKRVEGVAWRAMIGDPAHPSWAGIEGDRLEWHLRTLMQVARAVHFAHSRGLLHRDLKPENVMIGGYGEVYVVDWGLALHLTDVPPAPASPSEPGSGDGRRAPQVVGTPAYMPPEMATGEHHRLGPWSDVYLLGSMLHEVLTGRPPHLGTLHAALMSAYLSEPHDYGPEVPAELADIAHRAMSARPEDRHASADAFVRALEQFLRQRGAFQLAREAGQRFAELEALLDARPAEPTGPGTETAARTSAAEQVQIYRLFGECRFGLQQALRAAPDQQPIRAVLERCIRRMARYELERRHPEAAAALLAELSDPPAKLWEQVEAQRQSERDRRQELESLRTAQRDQDVHAGERARAWVAVALAVGFNLVVNTYVQSIGGHNSMTRERSVAIAVCFLVSLLLAGAIARRSLFQNAGSRRLSLAVLVVTSGWTLNAVASLLSKPTLEQMMTSGMMVLGTGVTTIAVAADRRLLPAGLWYLVGGLVFARLQGQARVLIPVIMFGGVMLLAAGWFMRRRPAPRDDSRGGADGG